VIVIDEVADLTPESVEIAITPFTGPTSPPGRYSFAMLARAIKEGVPLTTETLEAAHARYTRVNAPEALALCTPLAKQSTNAALGFVEPVRDPGTAEALGRVLSKRAGERWAERMRAEVERMRGEVS
jgi:hypothetical protein